MGGGRGRVTFSAQIKYVFLFGEKRRKRLEEAARRGQRECEMELKTVLRDNILIDFFWTDAAATAPPRYKQTAAHNIKKQC